MSGISDKAGKSPYAANKFKYNGIEYDSAFNIDEYEARYRDLDPQLGRWWQIDPESEKERVSISPYASMASDPVFKTDPLGNEDDACCKGLVNVVKNGTRDVFIFSASALNALGSNMMLGAGRADPTTMSGLTDHDKQVAQWGQTTGDAAAIGTGAMEVGGAATRELASFGIATPLALGIGAHGIATGVMGATNLTKDFQRVNNQGSENGGDDPGKRRMTRLPDKGDPNTTQTNEPESGGYQNI